MANRTNESNTEYDLKNVEQMTAVMNDDQLPKAYLKYTKPYHEKVKGMKDHLEAYVRLQRRAGCIRIIVPFPAGPVKSHEKTFRISDHMTAADLLEHAQYTNKLWSKKSLALRREFISPDRARRMTQPDEHGCIGNMRYRRAINQFAVTYVDERGFMRQKIFHIPREKLNDIVAVYEIRDKAVAFVKKMLDTGTGTPIRRQYRRPFHIREVNPITRYFSNVKLAQQNTDDAKT